MHAPVHGVRNCSTAAVQNSTSFLLSYSPNRPELNSINYEILEVYTSKNMSFKSTKLKKFSYDWLNSGKAVIQHLSEIDAIFVFPCFAR